MSTLTISPTPSQCEGYADELGALEGGLRERGLSVVVEPRGEPRGPVADVLIYLGGHGVDAGLDLLLLEVLRRIVRRGDAEQTPTPRRFVLVDEAGETVKVIELPE
ncbi:MAG: hypothetical protein ITG02_00340 [Patulibacter sp.]|nr:hypothetical protein [Patulibacter sp.]